MININKFPVVIFAGARTGSSALGEYISKKYILVNRKAELRGKLEAFEQNRTNRFEPAIQFVKEAKTATILLAEKNPEKNRDFLRKIGSNFQLAEKRLSVELKNPWKIVAEFNSAFLFETNH